MGIKTSSTSAFDTQNSATSRDIVNKVWNYAQVLRDDGMGYGDYVAQITF
jgi:type I restriction enzyme M protein